MTAPKWHESTQYLRATEHKRIFEVTLAIILAMVCVILLFSYKWQIWALPVFIVYAIQFSRICRIAHRRKLAWDMVEEKLAELEYWQIAQDYAEERASAAEAP